MEVSRICPSTQKGERARTCSRPWIALRAPFGDQRSDHPAQHFGIALGESFMAREKARRSAGLLRAMFGHSRER